MSLTISPSPFGSLVVSVAETGSTLSVTTVATSPSVLTMALGVPGPAGATGSQGPAGTNGTNGVGVAAGGTTGQALVKLSSTNYDTGWATITSGGGTWGSITGTLSNQTDLYNALNGKLSLTGGTMSGTIFGSGNDYFDLISYQATDGTDPINGIIRLGSAKIVDTDYAFVGVASDAQTLGLYANGGTFIKFGDNSVQTTAFPPAGGTTSQYIDGTGALQTFPTAATKMVTTVRNNSGATITKGTVVYINGAVGNKPTIAKAQANSESTSKATFAFVQTDILNNTEGDVVQLGLLENINTQGFTDGQQIFLSPTTAGGWTSTQPFSPYHYVRLGTIIRGGHPTQGSISINIINGFQLDELSDVGSTAPSNNNVLTWQSSTSQWMDKSIATILGYTPANGTDYLAKADNLSGLASTSTARSNLGLTSLATASYATTSEAQAGTSTTTVISPSTLLDAKYFQGGKSMVQIAWSTSVSGTGAFAGAQNSNARLNIAPTTATGYAIASAIIANNSRGSIYNSGFDFSKRVQFGVRVARNVASPDSASVFRFSIGKGSATDASDLSARGLMIKVAGSGALQLLVHNGTTLTTTTSSFTPANGQAYDVIVTSDGAGNCALFVNGSSVATSTGGPTTSGLANANYLMFEVQNTSTLTGSPQNIIISDYHVQVNS